MKLVILSIEYGSPLIAFCKGIINLVVYSGLLHSSYLHGKHFNHIIFIKIDEPVRFYNRVQFLDVAIYPT